jgi:hypothetical protein
MARTEMFWNNCDESTKRLLFLRLCTSWSAQDDGITLKQACSEVHSLASWLSGRTYTYEAGGWETVVKRISFLGCDRKEEIVILWRICVKKKKNKQTLICARFYLLCNVGKLQKLVAWNTWSLQATSTFLMRNLNKRYILSKASLYSIAAHCWWCKPFFCTTLVSP